MFFEAAKQVVPLPQNGSSTISSLNETNIQQSWLYRMASFPVRFYRRFLRAPRPTLESGDFYSNKEFLLGAEIQEALQGRYGAATRISSGGQRSVNLYSAIPIRNGDRITGVVLVSQSTYRILRDVYVLRLDIFRIFLFSLAAAVTLSLIVSTTIARPIRMLRNQAREMLNRRGRFKSHFRTYKRRDEIGDLSRALKELTLKLEEHIQFIESFASDVSHEFKNPLASIRSAAEMMEELSEHEERARFLKMVLGDVARMEHLLAGIREENLERIFDRFFCCRPEASSKEEHTGLGLAIVKVIVEAYGGTVSVSNRQEGGTPALKSGCRFLFDGLFP